MPASLACGTRLRLTFLIFEVPYGVFMMDVTVLLISGKTWGEPMINYLSIMDSESPRWWLPYLTTSTYGRSSIFAVK